MLITGAGSGIGSEIAKMFTEAGAHVGFHFRFSSNNIGIGGYIVPFRGDLLDKEFRQNLLRQFLGTFDGIDILINNAGGCLEYKHYSELNEKEWDRMFELHVKVPFFLSRDAMNFMIQQNWGRIIFISTAAIRFGGINNMHYTASKAAMDSMMKAFARDGAPNNVLVNSIRPGLIDTPMRFKTDGYNEERWQARSKLIPLGHVGKPKDVAGMVLHLCSEYGDYITGETFRIAGGE
ncbi:SDR family oxidoreductase [Candidatus Giovannonibacteria bacterium]|nr:SDR family oxidoreductase [Candidatus Giovannonibacteria bacterium]